MSASKGRPPSENPRCLRVSVRFTLEEYAALQTSAMDVHLPLSDFIRRTLLGQRKPAAGALIRHDLSRLVVHLTRHGADSDLIDEIRQAIDRL